MLFNSYVFWCFFAIVVSVYWLLRHKHQNVLLLVASYVFYGWWDWRFLLLLIASTLVDFVVGRAIEGAASARGRKIVLCCSFVFNLGILGFFKYANFFTHEFLALMNSVGVSVSIQAIEVILPVGISFYTFQSMSYVIDVYRKEIPASRNLLEFGVFVAFFPQLMAGPIERYRRMMPQYQRPRVWQSSYFGEGLYHVLLGLFKKLVVADNLAPIAGAVFGAPTRTLTGVECWLGVYAFAFQIYGDFSGYSSMAKGLAKWLGIDLIDNFRLPYFAVSPSDFWRRWHIGLSSWLRDYLYIPLGGNRRGPVRTYLNLLTTMTLGGLWHGANWTFIVWGAYHGALLAVYRRFDGVLTKLLSNSRMAKLVSILLLFHLVCLGWLFFRAQTFAQASTMFVLMLTNFHVTAFSEFGFGMILFFITPLIIFEIWLERSGDLAAPLHRRSWVRGIGYAYAVLMMWFFSAEQSYEFIYFQF